MLTSYFLLWIPPRLSTIDPMSYQRLSLLHLTGATVTANAESYLRECQIIGPNDDYENECTWRAITCTEGKLQEIVADGYTIIYPWNLQWFPKSTQRIDVQSISIKDTLPTRALPACLVDCSITRCALIGTLSLQTLPMNIVRLELRQNCFEGTVCLVGLPRTLAYLGLNMNAFVRIVGLKQEIPPGILLEVAQQFPKKVVGPCTMRLLKVEYLDDALR